MFSRMMESSRVLLIHSQVVAWSWSQVYILHRHLFISPQVNIIKSELFSCFIVLLILIWRWCLLRALCL